MIYDFKCNKCGKSFELRLHLKEYENQIYKCPFCNSSQLKRIYPSKNYMLGLQFKGEGFYVNDYKKKETKD